MTFNRLDARITLVPQKADGQFIKPLVIFTFFACAERKLDYSRRAHNAFLLNRGHRKLSPASREVGLKKIVSPWLSPSPIFSAYFIRSISIDSNCAEFKAFSVYSATPIWSGQSTSNCTGTLFASSSQLKNATPRPRQCRSA